MSQFENPYSDVSMMEEPKTSGLAIASLVLSLIGIIPCLGLLTAPIGVLLGIIGIATISGPAKKGKGLATAGVLIGVILFSGQLYLGKLGFDFVNNFFQVVETGPRDALTDGFGGDFAAFKASFHGDGSTTSDEEVRVFLDTLRERYGEYQSSQMDQTGNSPMKPVPGQASLPIPYIVTFSNGDVDVEAEIIFADPSGTTPGFINKLGYILFFDSDLGDLRYPSLDGDDVQPAPAETIDPDDATPPEESDSSDEP